MKMYLSSLVVLFICLSLFFPKTIEADEKKYSSSTSFSSVLTGGNNRNFSLSFDTEQNLRLGKNKLNLKGTIIHSSSNKQKRSEIYYAHFKYNRETNSRAYFLSLVSAERNKLAGYDYRFGLSAGVGYGLIDSEKVEIFSEVTFGWNSESSLEYASFPSSIISNVLIYNITVAVQLTCQEILFLNLEDLRDYRLNLYSSISASISRNFALKTSIQIFYEHNPVFGHRNTDFFLLSSIVIKI